MHTSAMHVFIFIVLEKMYAGALLVVSFFAGRVVIVQIAPSAVQGKSCVVYAIHSVFVKPVASISSPMN